MAAAQDVIGAIQDCIGAVSGIKAAPDYPPGDMDTFPFSAAFEGSGVWAWYTSGSSYGSKKGLLTVVVEIHLALISLPTTAQAAAYYSEAIPNAILKGVRSDRLSGTVVSVGSIESSGLIPMAWGSKDVNTLGYRFVVRDINVKNDIT